MTMKQDGKLSLTMLDRSVKKHLTPRRNDLLLGAFAGRDFSAWQDQTEGNAAAEAGRGAGAEGTEGTGRRSGVGELRFATQSAILYRSEPAVREKLILGLIHRVANDLYAGGNTRLLTAQAAITLPAEGFEEKELKELMRTLTGELTRLGADLSGGHTMQSRGVKDPILSLTMIGCAEPGLPDSLEKAPRKAQKTPSVRLDLILSGKIGKAGSSILAALSENREGIRLSTRYSEDFLRGALSADADWSVKAAADLAFQYAGGPLWVHNLSEGGAFDGLWEFGERLGSGMKVDLRKIPISQETVELSEFFGVHPYRLLSAGALLIACENGEELVRILTEHGIEAVLIGETTPGERARVFQNEEEIRYMEKPQGEELWDLLI